MIFGKHPLGSLLILNDLHFPMDKLSIMYTRAGTSLLILTVLPPGLGGQEPEQLRVNASDANAPSNDL
jgi:hypothetical protein